MNDRSFALVSVRPVNPPTATAVDLDSVVAQQEGITAMAGAIAHLFNNILAVIVGNASLAMEEVPADSAVRPRLEAVLAASERAAHITRQMLTCSGQGRFAFQVTCVAELVRAAVEGMLGSIPEWVQVLIETAGYAPGIEAAPEQIDRLVVNLVENAVEAVGEQAGTVTVATGYVQRDVLTADSAGPALLPGRYVVIEVSDTGCGIDDAVLPRMFDPFFSTKTIGRGLGLPVVLGIVRQHQGGIQVRSSPGRGSTFRVYLPVIRTG